MDKQIIAEVPKSAFDALMKFPWLYFTLHGDTNGNDNATNAVDRAFANLNGQATALFTSGTKAVSGTTTNIWSANAGWFTNAGNNYLETLSGADLKAFHELETLSGGLLIAFRFWLGADANLREYIYSYSAINTTNGGFEVLFETKGKVTVLMREQNNSGATTVLTTSSDPSTGAEHTCLIYLDTASGTPVMYIDGVAQANPVALPTPLPDLGTQWTMFARSDGAQSNPINSQGTPARRIRDVLVVRCTDDIRSDIASIATKWHQDLGEIPRLLTTA